MALVLCLVIELVFGYAHRNIGYVIYWLVLLGVGDSLGVC